MEGVRKIVVINDNRELFVFVAFDARGITDAVESVVRVNDSTFAEAVIVEELIKIILDNINIIEINLSNTKIRDARIDRIPTN